MADLFNSFGIEPPTQETIKKPVDIFSSMGIAPPTVSDINKSALAGTDITNLPEEDFNILSENKDRYDSYIKQRFSDEKIAALKAKGKIGFIESLNFLDYQDVLPAGGVYNAIDLGIILNAGKKIKAGEKLGDSEEYILNKYIDDNLEMAIRGTTIGGDISYYGSQMPAFAIEFMATGGVGKTAQLAVEKVVSKGVQSAIIKKGVGVTANLATRTAATPTMYLPTYRERRVNDFMAVTDKGQIVFQESKEAPAMSALKAYGYTMAEITSEVSGPVLAKGAKYIAAPLTAGVSKYVAPNIVSAVSKLPLNVRLAVYEAYKKIQPSASMKKVFTAVGWNGMLAEMGEERVADVLRASLDMATEKDYTIDDYLDAITPSKDQILVELGIMSIAHGVSHASSLTQNILMQKMSPAEAKTTVANMSETEKEQFVSDNLIKNKEVDIDNNESFFNQFYREAVDRFDPIRQAVDKARNTGKDINVMDDAYSLARSYSGGGGNVKNNLEFGTTRITDDGKTVITGKSLKAIGDDLSHSISHIEKNVNKRLQDFNDYLIANRNIQDLVNNENVEVSEKAKQQSLKIMQKLSNKYGKDFQLFEVFGKEMYGYQQRVLHNLVDAGVISEKQYSQITETHPNYIPFKRVFEENEIDVQETVKQGLFTKASSKSIIKKIKGSDRDVKNVYQSVMLNTQQILDTAHRNRVALSLADLADVIPDRVQKIKPLMQKFVVDGKETYRPSGVDPKGAIVVYRDGKKQYYRVSKPLLHAMENIDTAKLPFVLEVLLSPFKLSATILRAGATLIPEFWMRNVLVDQHTAFLQSPVRPTPIDMIVGLSSAIGKGELYWDWMRNGGSFNSYINLNDKNIERAYNEMFKKNGKITRYLKNPLLPLQQISGILEEGTRIGAFKKARENGFVGIEAALISREATLDFDRGGRASKKLNEFVPFFNVGVQSVDKLARTFKERPLETTMWGVATITLPSVLITGYYLYGASDEERKEYLEIPQWQKDIFWVFKVGDEWRRYKKPFSFGYAFGSVPERFMTWAYSGDKPEMKEFWQDLASGVLGSVSPVYDSSSLLPPILKVSFESWANKNFFTGRDIYPDWMDSYPKEKRATKGTSETAILIGEKLGRSPAVVENTMRGTIAGASDYVTDAGDLILKAVKQWNGETVIDKPITNSDIPVIKAFSVREPVGYSTNSVANFFDVYKELSDINTYSSSIKGEEKYQYQEEHQKEISLYNGIKPYYERIRDLGKMSNAIYEDEFMASEEKVQQLSDFGTQILDTAIEANAWYEENK